MTLDDARAVQVHQWRISTIQQSTLDFGIEISYSLLQFYRDETLARL